MVQPIEASDVDAAGGVLARAFRDNPGVSAVLQGYGPEDRLRIGIPSMTGFVKAVRRHGVAECIKQDGRIAAVSLSFPPGAFPPPLRFELMIAWGPLRAGLKRSLRFMRVDKEMRRRHPTYPHWYLWFLGTEPELQGKGHGSELLKVLAARAVEDRVPCYLETDKETSVRLYQRHDYNVLSEEMMPGLGFKLWFMRTPMPPVA
jgi:ribosomal protein S18 acetylase RimI-like enzyme